MVDQDDVEDDACKHDQVILSLLGLPLKSELKKQLQRKSDSSLVDHFDNLEAEKPNLLTREQVWNDGCYIKQKVAQDIVLSNLLHCVFIIHILRLGKEVK